MNKISLKNSNPSRLVALVGIMAATISCAKLALSFLPNVEVVTFLIAVYSYVFGFAGVISALVFVCVEPLIWGFGAWVITYFIYWPALALLFCLLGKTKRGTRWSATGIALAMTLLFGVLSSVIDVLFLTGITPYFFGNLLLFYSRGFVFYAIQLACNAVLFFTLFEFTVRKLAIIKGERSDGIWKKAKTSAKESKNTSREKP